MAIQHIPAEVGAGHTVIVTLEDGTAVTGGLEFVNEIFDRHLIVDGRRIEYADISEVHRFWEKPEEDGLPPVIEEFASENHLARERVKLIQYREGHHLVSTMDFEEFVKWGMLSGAENTRNVEGTWMAVSEVHGHKLTIALAIKIHEHAGQETATFADLVNRLN